MRAVRWHGPQDVRLADVSLSAPKRGEITVRVRYCGLCGTDFHEVADGPHLISTTPHRLTGRAAPLTLGHEIVGTITDVGPGVIGLQAGQRVAVEPCIRCGACDACRSADSHHCPHLGGLGLAADGGLAEHVVVPAYTAFLIPESVPDEVAALTEPLAVALRAVRRGGVRSAASVVVNGFGPIGAGVALWCRHVGAANIVVVEPSPLRRDVAQMFDVDDVVDPAERDLPAVGRDGHRPEVVIDCSGIAGLLEGALRCVAPGGTVVWTGVGPGSCELAPSRLTAGERTVAGALGHAPFGEVLRVLDRGRLQAQRLISAIEPLDAAPSLLKQQQAGRSPLKVLIEP